MKRFLQILIVSIIPIVALADASFGVGTYNVRFKNDGDEGVHHWDNRREYVVRTITECGFDILGLNEMNTGSMYEYLKEALPQRGFEVLLTGYRTDKDPESVQAHPIVYRKSMFDVLDKGVFYLNINTSTPGTSWDNSTHQRSTHWAKMRVKETGDIFYFFTTHLDHKGLLSRNEQIRINFEKVRSIAGEYPSVLAGDHNTGAGCPPFYNLFASYMLDTKTAAEIPFTEQYDGTLCGWDPNTYNYTRLDYIWVRGFKVHTYEPLRETFDTPYLPSDHLALLSRVTLLTEQKGLLVCHMNPNAAPGGDGSATAPFATFAEAQAATRVGGTIKVVAGKLAPESDDAFISVDKSLVVIGGYNPQFSAVSGVTEIEGDNSRRLIDVNDKSFLELSNFTISKGYSNSVGGGIRSLGPVLKLSNVNITDCHADTGGGAIYAAQQLNADNCEFAGNTAGDKGGAIFADRVSSSNPVLWWRYFMSNCSFDSNTAAQGSAIYVAHYPRCSFFNCAFVRNHATDCATVFLGSALCQSQASAANCTFACNTVEAVATGSDAVKGGSALFADMQAESSLALMNCTVVGNACSISGTPGDDYCASTVQLPAGKVYVYSSIFGGNVTDSAAPADILAAVGAGSFNCYSCAAAISYRKSIIDFVSASPDEAITRLKAIYGCEADENGLLLPEVTIHGGKTPTVVMHSTHYGTDDLNSVPKTQFSEALTHADVDNDAEFKSTISTDQRGFKRRTNGTSTMGATEFSDFDGIASPQDNENVCLWHQDGSDLVLSASQPIAIFDISGRLVANCPSGLSRLTLAPAIYVIKSSSNAIKIAIK